jgi:tellurite resistance-related uncharacterized protein
MQCRIAGVQQDNAGDWMALLDCLHRQHLREQPPFAECARILGDKERAEHPGATPDSPLCERFEWPADLVAYRQTPEFTADTAPTALLKEHATKRGVWARVEVREGRLLYTVPAFGARFELASGQAGVVVTEVPHRVAPCRPVRCLFVFHRRD